MAFNMPRFTPGSMMQMDCKHDKKSGENKWQHQESINPLEISKWPPTEVNYDFRHIITFCE